MSRFGWHFANEIALGLLEAIRPFCEKAEVGGSLRRESEDVKDVELIVCPRRETRTVKLGDLFGTEEPREFNVLYEEWASMGAPYRITRATRTEDIVTECS